VAHRSLFCFRRKGFFAKQSHFPPAASRVALRSIPKFHENFDASVIPTNEKHAGAKQ
jgi:hypothetical protein